MRHIITADLGAFSRRRSRIESGVGRSRNTSARRDDDNNETTAAVTTRSLSWLRCDADARDPNDDTPRQLYQSLPPVADVTHLVVHRLERHAAGRVEDIVVVAAHLSRETRPRPRGGASGVVTSPLSSIMTSPLLRGI